MIPKDIAKELHSVPESIVREYADHIGGENNFKKLLEAAAIFRHVNANPIFLANRDGSEWAVTSEETYLTNLH